MNLCADSGIEPVHRRMPPHEFFREWKFSLKEPVASGLNPDSARQAVPDRQNELQRTKPVQGISERVPDIVFQSIRRMAVPAGLEWF